MLANGAAITFIPVLVPHLNLQEHHYNYGFMRSTYSRQQEAGYQPKNFKDN